MEHENVGDVRLVYITSEVAARVKLNATYMLRLAKEIGLSEHEMRPAGPRGFLFNEGAIRKIEAANSEKIHLVQIWCKT